MAQLAKSGAGKNRDVKARHRVHPDGRGATRRDGSTSASILWERIAIMRLGRRHGFSTLRWSLGSILASAHDLPAIDEVGLTQWMHAHLRLIAIPVDDPDILDGLETEMLTELDRPLNLAKVSKTRCGRDCPR